MVIYRQLTTPDGTILKSNHRHDFCRHEDKNGKTYMLDGGHSGYYYRSSMNGDEKFLEVTLSDPFTVKREYFERYNQFTKEYVKMKDMSNEWIENLLIWLEDSSLE